MYQGRGERQTNCPCGRPLRRSRMVRQFLQHRLQALAALLQFPCVAFEQTVAPEGRSQQPGGGLIRLETLRDERVGMRPGSLHALAPADGHLEVVHASNPFDLPAIA